MPQTRRAIVFVLALAVSGSLVVEAQQQKPPAAFRTDVNVVELHVSVMDKNGAPIHGLTKKDFAVVEDGKPAPLDTCDEIHLPMPQPALPGVPEADGSVADNGTASRARLYAIVIDRAHLPPDRSGQLKTQLTTFINDFMADGDTASVINLTASPTATPFTSNKARLRAAVGSLSRSQGSAAAQADDLVLAPTGTNDDEWQDNIDAFKGTETERQATESVAMFQSVQRLSEFLHGLQGRRKAMVFVSSGVAVNALIDSGQEMDASGAAHMTAQQPVADQFRQLLQTLVADNITVYGIDPVGLRAVDPRGGVDQLGAAHELLGGMSDVTGGFSTIGANDLTRPFERIVSDNSDYYVLSYASSLKPTSKGYDIKVNVLRPDARVRVREHVGATSSGTKDPTMPRDEIWQKSDVASLLARPLATADPGLHLRATAAIVGWRDRRAIVQTSIETPGTSFGFRPARDGWSDAVEVGMQALADAGGAPVGKSEKVSMNIRPETKDAIAARGWRYAAELSLLPGAYQLRIAMAESGSSRSGSVFLDLVVPSAEKFTVAGVALTSTAARFVPTAGDSPVVHALDVGPVGVSRVFSTTDTLRVIASVLGAAATRVSDSGTPNGGDVAMMAELRPVTPTSTPPSSALATSSLRSRPVSSTASRTVTATDAANSPTVLTMPLKDVAPGYYLLIVTAKQGTHSSARSLNVRVVQ